MELTKKYVDINDTMRHIKTQIVDSLPYAKKQCPPMSSPEECFWWMKRHTTYKHDPKGIELLQSLPTLMENNYHGISGAGDCDCFTIGLCSLFVANGIKNVKVVLVGRNRSVPVHIYCVVYEKGNRKVFDLTNKKPYQERPYPYIQELPRRWENW